MSLSKGDDVDLKKNVERGFSEYFEKRVQDLAAEAGLFPEDREGFEMDVRAYGAVQRDIGSRAGYEAGYKAGSRRSNIFGFLTGAVSSLALVATVHFADDHITQQLALEDAVEQAQEVPSSVKRNIEDLLSPKGAQ